MTLRNVPAPSHNFRRMIKTEPMDNDVNIHLSESDAYWREQNKFSTEEFAESTPAPAPACRTHVQFISALSRRVDSVKSAPSRRHGRGNVYTKSSNEICHHNFARLAFPVLLLRLIYFL